MMQIQLSSFTCQNTNVKKQNSTKFNEKDLNSSAIKKLLKIIEKNINKKISSITKLQRSILAAENELKNYFEEEKKLVSYLKDKDKASR